MAYTIRAVYDNGDNNPGTGLTVASVVLVTGDVAVVWVTYALGTTLAGTVSDGTNTYTRFAAGDISDATSTQSAACFVAFNVTSGTYTVTYTPALSEAYRGAVVVVASGLATSGTPDFAVANNNAPGTATDGVSSGNVSPSGQPAMLLAFCLDVSGNGTTLTQGTNFASISTMPNIAIAFGVVGRVEHKRITSTSAVPATFTASVGSGRFLTTALIIQELAVPSNIGSQIRKNLIHPGRHPDRFGKRLKTRRFNTAPALSTLTGTAAVQSQGDAAASSGSPVISGTATPASKSDAVSASSQTVISGTGAVISKGDSESASGYAVVPVPSRIARRTQHPAIRGPYNPIRLRRTVNTTPPAAPAITGSAAILSGGDQVSASGAPTISGTASAMAAGDAATASGTPSITGTATVTAQADKVSAAGSPVVSGSATVKDAGDIAIASQNAAPVTGTAAILSRGDSDSAAGSPVISGSAAIVPKADSATAIVSLLITGFGSVLNADDFAAASGTLKVTGTAAVASQGDASAASGTFPVTGTAAVRSGNDFTFFPPSTGTVFSNYEEFLEDD